MQVRPSRSYLLPHILRRLLRGRETIPFPQGPLELRECYRGQVAVDITRCRACGLCARACPTNALRVAKLKGGGVQVSIAHDRCANCSLCERACRFGAIRLSPFFATAMESRQNLCEGWRREGPYTPTASNKDEATQQG